MNRIKFNTSASDSGAYELSINPSDLELNQDNPFHSFEVVDDGPVNQRPAFDGRMRKMVWMGGLRTNHTAMVNQLAVLKGYKGTVRYIKFQDAAYGDIDSSTWYKHRIVSIEEKLRRGGVTRWDSITMLFQPEA